MTPPYSPPGPGHYRLAELLTFVRAVRHVAFDVTLPAIEAIGRVRDLFTDYDKGDQP